MLPVLKIFFLVKTLRTESSLKNYQLVISTPGEGFGVTSVLYDDHHFALLRQALCHFVLEEFSISSDQ